MANSVQNSAQSQRTIYAEDMFSQHLQENRHIKVFLPPGIDLKKADRRYPVLYCHDGNEFFTHGRIVTLTKQLLESGEVQPFIIVALAVQMATRTADYSPMGERHGAYVRFVMEEAVPWVESHFPAAVDSKHKFMAGVSLGAAASLSIYFKEPSTFNKLLLFSGAFDESLQEKVQKSAGLSNLHTFMVAGRQETAVETSRGPLDIYHLNTTMRDFMRLHGAQVSYQETDGSHVWGLWQSFIPEAVRWLNREVGKEGSF